MIGGINSDDKVEIDFIDKIKEGMSIHPQTKKLTFCALVAAIGVVIMLLGGVIGIGTYVSPIICGLVLIPVIDEYGAKYALITYAVTGLLALILVSDKELALFYICTVGWFTCFKEKLDTMPKAVSWAVKLILFNASVIAMYAVIFAVIGMEKAGFSSWWFVAVMLMLGNVTFIFYDLVLSRIVPLYRAKIRKRIFSGRREEQ